MSNILEIKDLEVEYKVSDIFNQNSLVHAVNGVSLDIKRGEIFAIAGESGCGKSTLAKAILKLANIKSGDVVLNLSDDKNISISKMSKKDEKLFREKAQMIFQNPYSSLNPKMKIYDILKEPLIINKDVKIDGEKRFRDLSKFEIDEYLKNIISKVGLEESSLSLYPHEFSGGQRQRIAIARALVLNPEIIIADEPVSALDVSIQAQIINMLKKLKEQFDLTIIFISHDLSVIEYISDSVAIMYLGEIVEQGTCDEIFLNPKHPYTKALLGSAPSFENKEKTKLCGELPSPTALPEGCKFHTRCPFAFDKCKREIPQKKYLSKTHFLSCFLSENK